MKAESHDNQVLKKIMIDVLDIQFNIEDILVSIKSMNCYMNENKRKNRIMNSVRQQITSISSLNQLGTAWMTRDTNLTPSQTFSGTGSCLKI